MNLRGFCHADPLCSTASQPNEAQIGAAGLQQYPAIGSAVSDLLYRVAARVGRDFVCPHLGAIGGWAGVGIAATALPAEIVLFNVGGVTIALQSEVVGYAIGFATGEELKSKLCG